MKITRTMKFNRKLDTFSNTGHLNWKEACLKKHNKIPFKGRPGRRAQKEEKGEFSNVGVLTPILYIKIHLSESKRLTFSQ